MNSVKFSDLLGRKSSIKILMTLQENPVHVRGLREIVGGSASTIQSRIREMKEAGLIEEKMSGDFPFKKMLKLTEVGEEMVTILSTYGRVRRKRRIEMIDFERNRERLKWPLLILLAHGGQGHTKLQKLTFLGKREFNLEIPYEFIPYKSGPYSKELARDMGRLTTLRFVDPFERSYELTEEGRRVARKAYDELGTTARQAIKQLKRFSRMSLRQLLNLVYKRYPEEAGSQNL